MGAADQLHVVATRDGGRWEGAAAAASRWGGPDPVISTWAMAVGTWPNMNFMPPWRAAKMKIQVWRCTDVWWHFKTMPWVFVLFCFKNTQTGEKQKSFSSEAPEPTPRWLLALLPPTSFHVGFSPKHVLLVQGTWQEPHSLDRKSQGERAESKLGQQWLWAAASEGRSIRKPRASRVTDPGENGAGVGAQRRLRIHTWL